MYNGKLLVLDVDDVLVHISTPWICLALEDPIVAAALPALVAAHAAAPYSFAPAVLRRRQPHIQAWLQEQYALDPTLLPRLDLAYRAHATFYANLPPTAFCETIIAAMSLPGRVAHVHIVTHNFSNTDPCVISKELWIRTHLGGPDRVTIHHLEAHQKKSEILKIHCPEPDAYADDALKNVVDVVLNDAVRPLEILIPRMGHNLVPENVVELATLRRIAITYYNP